MSDQIRRVLLEVIKAKVAAGYGLQLMSVVPDTIERLGLRHNEDGEQRVLASWYDLFRTGEISWGFNLANPNPPFAHITPLGRKTLATADRDPANPSGFAASLEAFCKSGTIERSYIDEAVRAYNADCNKAAAVLVGGAAEAMVLGIRDELVAKFTAAGKSPPSKLTTWQAKTVLDAVEVIIDAEIKAKRIDKALGERFESFWSAFTGQLRMSRNDAGHPSSVDPVTREIVHGNLLIFPELARLATDLRAWFDSSFTP